MFVFSFFVCEITLHESRTKLHDKCHKSKIWTWIYWDHPVHAHSNVHFSFLPSVIPMLWSPKPALFPLGFASMEHTLTRKGSFNLCCHSNRVVCSLSLSRLCSYRNNKLFTFDYTRRWDLRVNVLPFFLMSHYFFYCFFVKCNKKNHIWRLLKRQFCSEVYVDRSIAWMSDLILTFDVRIEPLHFHGSLIVQQTTFRNLTISGWRFR